MSGFGSGGFGGGNADSDMLADLLGDDDYDFVEEYVEGFVESDGDEFLVESDLTADDDDGDSGFVVPVETVEAPVVPVSPVRGFGFSKSLRSFQNVSESDNEVADSVVGDVVGGSGSGSGSVSESVESGSGVPVEPVRKFFGLGANPYARSSESVVAPVSSVVAPVSSAVAPVSETVSSVDESVNNLVVESVDNFVSPVSESVAVPVSPVVDGVVPVAVSSVVDEFLEVSDSVVSSVSVPVLSVDKPVGVLVDDVVDKSVGNFGVPVSDGMLGDLLDDEDDFDSLSGVGETFFGFGSDGVEVVPEGGFVSPVGEVSGSSSMLDDLLGDEDEYVGVGSGRGGVAVSESVSEVSDSGVGGGVSSAVGLDEFRGVLGGRPLVPDADKVRLDAVSEGYRADNDAARAVRSEAAALKPVGDGVGSRAISSDFKRFPVREVVVPESGVVGAGDRGVAPKRGSKERYRYVRSNGRLNGAELEFFKNLEVTKKGSKAGDSRAELLRGRVVGNESEAERKVRSVLYGQAVSGADALKRGSKLRFVEKDRETLQFLAMFRYATDHQLARMFGNAQVTMYNRLKKLRAQGLVIDKKLYGARPIWFLTEAGMLLSGFDLPRVTESKMSFSMFPHQFTVNNTAANLWGANINVLGLPDYPQRLRVDGKGNNVFGEQLVSELEIQSSLGKVKMFDKGEVFNPQMRAQMDRDFSAWERAGGVGFGESPEFQLGNEYMWAITPPYNVKLAYHVPDLVIKRDRNADGSPNSIAVEIEINNKPSRNYEKTLRAYKSDMRIYSKVIWVCKNRGPARKLEQIAKEIGMYQDNRIEIVPVITEDGVFKERDLWTI